MELVKTKLFVSVVVALFLIVKGNVTAIQV